MNGNTNVNDQVEKMWKEIIMAYFYDIAASIFK